MSLPVTATRRPRHTRAPLALMFGAVLGAPALAAQSPDDAVPRPIARAARATGPIRVDGRLDEADWQRAEVIGGFRQIEPEQGQPSRVQTVARVLFDGERLYIGVEVRDSLDVAARRVPSHQRDFEAGATDLIGIALDALHDDRNPFTFITTPYGAQRDEQVFDGGSQVNANWDGVWIVRTARDAAGWTAEFAIPFATLRYRPDGQPWGLNVWRVARGINEVSAWQPWPRQFAPSRMTFAGRLGGLEPPRPRTNLRLRPFVLGAADRIGAGGAAREEITPFAGGEAIWAPTPNDVIEATVRTDFAQADVDRQVVNLTRFSVFFPERRQFFLENASLFELGITGSYVVRPFFSRAIGLGGDGEPIPIQGGLRAVHRDDRLAAGALAIRQSGALGSGGTSFAVSRVTRYFGQRGRIGALAVGRFDEAGRGAGALGAAQSGTAGLDFFTRVTEQLTVSGMISRTTSSAAGGEGTGATWFIGRDTPTLYTGFLGAYVTSQYRPTVGFVSRPNVLYLSPAFRWDWRPAWRPAWLRSIRPGGYADLFHDSRTLGLQEGTVSLYTDLVWQSGALFYPDVQRVFQRPRAAFPLVRGVTIPAGEQDDWRVGFVFRSDPSRALSGNVRHYRGGFFNGRAQTTDLTLRLAPSPVLQFAAAWQINRLQDVGVERARVTTHLVQPEVRVSPNPRLQLSLFYQYNSDAQRGTLNGRLSWEFAPLSFVYVVYNDRRTVGTLDGPTPPLLPAQQLLVKVVRTLQL